MIDLNLRMIFLIVLTFGIALYLYLERNKFDREGIAFLRRTQTGIDTIDRVAKRLPRFWKLYAGAGVVTGLISIVLSLGSIGYSLGQSILTRSVENGPSLVLPGAVSQNQFQAGVSLIPVEYWIAGVAITVVVHELSHAVVARLEGFNIKSIGYGFLAIIPIGFVEPEGDKSLKEGVAEAGWTGGDWKSRIKVLCAGSFANYLTAAIFALLAVGFTAGITSTTSTGYLGISVFDNESVGYQAQQGYPAAEAGLTNGTLYSINDQQINTLEDLRAVSETIQPGDEVTMNTSEGVQTVTAAERELTRMKDGLSEYRAGLSWFLNLLFTVAFLNFAIGLFNMLPIVPLDGGLTVQALVERFIGQDKVKYVGSFSLAMWAVLILTIAASVIGL
jgi:membrane-associated protease RseP (regulator of RpoE activity)